MGIRSLLAALAALALPAGPAKNRLLELLVPGWRIHRGAVIGHVLLLGVRELEVGDEVLIAGPTVIRQLRRLEVGRESLIGSWNWISAAEPLGHLADSAGTLILAEAATITSRHYIDCSGGVTIGTFGGLAGVRSTIISHGVDISRNEHSVGPISIGEYTMVGSNSNLTPGSSVPDHCVVGMGSTVVPGLTASYSLYAGAPAVFKRELPAESAFFSRTVSEIPAPPARDAG